MRTTLVESRQQAPEVEAYPAGSIVLCQACLKPLYRLERGIGVGEKAGRAASAFKPVRPQDLAHLAEALDAGVVAMARAWTEADIRAHCARIPEVQTGAPAVCPCCQASYVRVRAIEAQEVHDRAYVWELITIPPGRALSGREGRAWTRS